MLERLFGSSSRSKIIKFFCTHYQERFYMRELARMLDVKLNALSRELDNLVELGFLKAELVNNKKYFAVDERFPLLHELQSMITKSTVLLEQTLVRSMNDLKGIQLFMLTGIFIQQDTDTDILLVGSVDRQKVQRLVDAFSRSFHQEIRFTVLTTAEYKYRKEVNDKFIYRILNTSPIVIINKIAQ